MACYDMVAKDVPSSAGDDSILTSETVARSHAVDAIRSTLCGISMVLVLVMILLAIVLVTVTDHEL